ncbi:MAG: SRPBCC family protein [Eubacterium sp.]|nr:SRPBCC family protein [Eubacterium sp.]
MKKSTITATFKSDLRKVWGIVTDNENTSWRSDLSRTEVTEDGFIEYTKDGFATSFTITMQEPFRCYAFTLDNANISGRWEGIFSPDGDGSRIIFTEEVTAKKPLMNLFISGYLKKQQQRYVEDLRKALGE